MNAAILHLIRGRIPAVVQVIVGVLTAAGFTIPEDTAQILLHNFDAILGAVIVLTAFVPGLMQKKK